MDNSKTFLLKKICGYATNGMEDLGSLNAKHIDSISKVMNDFAQEAIITAVNMLAGGGTVDIGNGKTLQLKIPKRRKK